MAALHQLAAGRRHDHSNLAQGNISFFVPVKATA
jgi:hypothetical protein